MSAYFIVIRDQTTNQSEMDAYAGKAPLAAAGHNIAIRAFYGRQSAVEGAPAEGIAILEFPTVAEAEAWYSSPAYQDALGHRKAGSKSRAFIVEGVD